jgi:hypothetical protein
MPVESVSSRREIDFSLPFFPQEMTALAFTPSWRRLDAAQQIRYTQIYALYLNEQTAFFEELLANTVLPALYQKPEVIGESLAENLRRFESEERSHSRWFREMNQRVDPRRFTMESGAYVFIPVGGRTRSVARWMASQPFRFPFWIWLMLLQEERSISLARACLDASDRLEPSFVELHRKHMADEVDHVRWDLDLIERIWMPLPLWKRKLHARLFGGMMAEFFTVPKRSAMVVLGALIDEFPELAIMGARFREEIGELRHSAAYHESLYSRTINPRCFALFDELPEFKNMGTYLPGYRRK